MNNLLLASTQSCIQDCLKVSGNTFGECSAGCGGGNVIPGISNPALGPSLQNIFTSSGGVGFFQTLLPNFVTLALIIGAIIFFFMLVIGAIQWISSGGDKAAIEAARGRITQALVGIVVLFSVFAIIKLIEVFFGIHILTLDIGPLIIK